MVKLSDIEYQAILDNEKRAVNELSRMRAELAEARKDGERYRLNWLSLQEPTGEDCLSAALAVVRHALRDAELLNVLDSLEGQYDLTYRPNVPRLEGYPTVREQLEEFLKSRRPK